jgi:hypothetical protein
MAIIHSLFDRGKKLKTGEVKVNSKNVSPDAVTAVATTGADLPLSLINKYEFINITSGAAARIVRLPAGCPVGTELILYVGANGCEVAVVTGETVNGGTDQTDTVPLAANSRGIFFKDTATHWTCNQIASTGAITAPTAD